MASGNALWLRLFGRGSAVPIGQLEEVFLTAGETSWLVPDNYYALASIECIGESGAGADGSANVNAGGGGGGGAYAAIDQNAPFSAVPGDVLNVLIGAGGSGSPTLVSDRTDTVRVSADYGRSASGSAGGSGGSVENCVGMFLASGGAGGPGASGTGNRASGGGGGAGGPDGSGSNGAGSAAAIGAGGGGAANGGLSANATSSSVGARGGPNRLAIGFGVAGTAQAGGPGANGGGGGGGASGFTGGAGSLDAIWGSFGPGSGAGGSGGATAGISGPGCGGAPSGGASQTGAGRPAGAASPGLIRITYWNGAPPAPPSDRPTPGFATGGAWPAFTIANLPAAFTARGNPSDYGYDANSIAGWDSALYQTVSNRLVVGVRAYHSPTAEDWAAGIKSNIEFVDFYINGGPAYRVTEMTLNPDTGIWVYACPVNPDDYPYGRRAEIRAVAYPTTGIPCVLQGQDFGSQTAPSFCSMFVFVSPGGSIDGDVRYVASSGSTGNTGLIPSSPWPSISYAKERMVASRGTIYITEPGNYAVAGVAEAPQPAVGWFTVAGDPALLPTDVVLNSMGGAAEGLAISYQSFSNLTLDVALSGLAAARTWLRGIKTGPGASFVGGDYLGARYVTDSDMYGSSMGSGSTPDLLKRNVRAGGASLDQVIRGGWNYKITVENMTDTGIHEDVFAPNAAIQNCILYQVDATNDVLCQQVFSDGDPWIDVAMDECSWDNTGSVQFVFQRPGVVDNWLTIDSSYVGSKRWNGALAIWPLYLNNVCVVNTPTFTPTWVRSPITGATNANPCVITQPGHSLVDGVTISISGVAGMTELNGNSYAIEIINDDQYSLKTTGGAAIDSSGYGTYVSGGSVSGGNSIPTGVTIFN